VHDAEAPPDDDPPPATKKPRSLSSATAEAVRDALAVAVVAVAYLALAVRFEFYERISTSTRRLESLQVDELPGVLLVVSLGLAWFAWRRLRGTHREMRARQAAIAALRQARAQLAEASQENRQLARQAIELQERERREVARELHDELGQYFHAIRMELGAVPGLIRTDPQQAWATLRRAESYVEHVNAVTRRIMNRLRPVGLDDLGLGAALQHLVDGWRVQRRDIAFEFEAAASLPELGEAETIALFRIAQEAMTNAARHAGASRVGVRLAWDGNAGNAVGAAGEGKRIALVVSDNGCGLPKTARHGIGLVGMRERIEGVGGALQVSSEPGRGTTVRAVLPVP